MFALIFRFTGKLMKNRQIERKNNEPSSKLIFQNAFLYFLLLLPRARKEEEVSVTIAGSPTAVPMHSSLTSLHSLQSIRTSPWSATPFFVGKGKL